MSASAEWAKGYEQNLIAMWTGTSMSAAQIARMYGVTRNAVIGWMTRHAPARGSNARYPLELCRRIAAEHYSGTSKAQLARRYKIPKSSIRVVIARGEAL